jgi:hypothetical protein
LGTNPVLAGAGPFLGSYECFAAGAQGSLTTYPDAPMAIGGVRLITITCSDATMPSLTISDDDGTSFTAVPVVGQPNKVQYTSTSLSARAKGGNKIKIVWPTPAHDPHILVQDFRANNTGTAQYVQLAAMPSHDGTPAASWLSGEIAVVKDGAVGDLVSFFEGNTGLHAAVSRDDGTSWSWVDGPGVSLGSITGAIAQDDNGKVHLVYTQVAGVSYARLTLVRDAVGHVTGFTADVTGVILPASVNTSGFVRTQIVVAEDGTAHPTLVYVIYDENGTGGRIQAGKTSVASGWTPTTGTDFVTLSNAAGATSIAILPFVNGFEGSHNCSAHLAQHPVSHDLWFQWGPIDTGDGITGNVNPVRRLRATPSGSTWTLGSPSTVAAFSTTAAEIASVYTTPNYVWLMYFSPTGGLTIDRAAVDGTVTAGAIPSPLTTPGSGGYISLAVDTITESRAFVGGWISNDSAGGPDFWAKYWNGSSWQMFAQTSPPGDVNGVGHSVGWDYGLALIQLDATTNNPSMATVRTV